jgi:Na+/melibiose symporter-like transporter
MSSAVPGGGHARASLRPVLAAEAASNFGSMLSRLAIPWLATLLLDATAWQMGLLLAADVAAAALGALALGAWVERREKRAVMLACDGARAALLALLAFAAWRGAVTMALLVAVAAAGALLTMAFELARSAWMAQCIDAQRLTRGNAQLAVATSLTETAAFALGGWFWQFWGALVALALDACSYLVSALCLRRVAAAPPLASAGQPRGDEPRWRAALAELQGGLRLLWRDARLRWLAALDLLAALAMSLAGTSYMIFVSRDIGFPTGTLGLVFAAGGLGSLLGAAWAARFGRTQHARAAVALGLLLAAAGAACTPLVFAVGWAGVALLLAQQVVGDAGMTLYQVHDRTLRQTWAPPELVTRVDAGMRTLAHSATLAGAAAGGAVAAACGTRAALWCAAAVLLLAAALAAGVLTRR